MTPEASTEEPITVPISRIRRAVAHALLDHFCPGVTETVLSETQADWLARDVVRRLQSADQQSE